MQDLNPFETVLVQADLTFKESSIWLTQQASTIPQTEGWKLHISANAKNALSILKKVVKTLKNSSVATFKCCRDHKELDRLNAGEYGATQKGKFITIYIWNQSQVVAIAEQLHASLKGHNNYPHIENELILGNGIFSRFGNFINQDRRDSATGKKMVPLLSLPNGKVIEESRMQMDSYCLENNPFSQSLLFTSNVQHSIRQNSEEYPCDLYRVNLIPVKTIKSNLYKCLYDKPTKGGEKLKIAKIANLTNKDACAELRKTLQFHQALEKDKLGPQNSLLENGEQISILHYEYTEGVTFRELLDSVSKETPFWELCTEDQIKIQEVLLKAIIAISKMHQNRIAHCDLTPNNIILSNNEEISFVDFETAQYINPLSSQKSFGYDLAKATQGYFSNDYLYPGLASIDVYSFGAILLELLYRIHPSRLNKSVATGKGNTGLFIPHKNCASNIIDVMTTSSDICDFVPLVNSLISSDNNDKKYMLPYLQQDYDSTDQYLIAGINSLSESQTESRMWRTYHESDYNNPVIDGSFNHGNAGIFVYIAKLSQYLGAVELFPGSDDLIKRLISYGEFEDKDVAGLHFGHPGVLFSALKIAVLSGSTNSVLIEKLIAETIEVSNKRTAFNGLDITHGLAGKLQLLHEAYKLKPSIRLKEIMLATAFSIGKQQSNDGSWQEAQHKDDPRSMLGFAHGVSGIIYSLSLIYQLFEEEDVFRIIERSIHFLFSNMLSANEHLCFASLVDSGTNHWWCRGEAGALLTLLKLAEVFGDDSFYNYACEMAPYTSKSINGLSNNLCQCHGLSGLGESYLSLYSFKNDPKWMLLASDIAKKIVFLADEFDDNSGLMTNALQKDLNPSLMTGYTGQCHFLLRHKLLIQHGEDIGHAAL